MAPYVRPPLSREVYLDDAGRPFEYGHRWGDDGPPEESYGVDTHPERFAALHTVADALVDHLTGTYAVDVVTADLTDVDLTAHSPDAPGHPVLAGWDDVERVRRAVVLRPRRDDAAPITLAWDDYPGVQVRAGALVSARFPTCGCDACDDTAASLSRDLETLVLGVAAGRMHEWVRRAGLGLRTCWVGVSTTADDGEWQSGEERRDRRDPAVRAGRARLRRLPQGRWRPWPAA
jgi:hypothetical protein